MMLADAVLCRDPITGQHAVTCPDCAFGLIESGPAEIDQPNRNDYDSAEDYEAEIDRRFKCVECGSPLA